MPPRRFTKDLLKSIAERDGATIIGEYDSINKNTTITFKCNCNFVGPRSFERIDTMGMFCRECVTRIGNERRVQTTLNNHGVTNISQIESVKLKKEETCQINYGVSNPSQAEEVKVKKEETCMKNLGVKYPSQCPTVRSKIMSIVMLRYGKYNPSQIEYVKEKKKSTTLLHFGVRSPAQSHDVMKKIIQTNQLRRGVNHPMQSSLVREMSRNTCIKRYGVPYAMQSTEVMERNQKNAKKFKRYIMPSGEIRRVQGYEPCALRDLLQMDYKEHQIKTGRLEVPRIPYIVEMKQKYHFPDIWIPHENKIVEVKSTWTYTCKEDNVLAKKKAAQDLGYCYEIWCYDNRGKKVIL